MDPQPPQIVLLTGATGSLGHYVLASLLAKTTAQIRVLLRPRKHAAERLRSLLNEIGIDLEQSQSAGRITLVSGSLPDEVGPLVAKGVDTIVHAAGCTRFQSDGSGEPARTNVDGTRALLDLASDQGVRHFVYISTAYVCGNRNRRIEETLAVPRPGFCNAYEESKWIAEQMVHRWQSNLRSATICRPTILFGDTQTGRTTSMTGIYVIARATEMLARYAANDPGLDRHAIPLRILGRPAATCNLIPVDWAAQRIVEIMLDPASRGKVHHVCNPAPPTHREVKAWLEEHFDVAGGHFTDERWPLPNANSYEETFYSLGSVVRDYFRDGLIFVSRDSPPNAHRLIDHDSFIQSLEYAQLKRWGRGSGNPVLVHRPRGVDAQWYFESFLPNAVPQSSIARIHSLTTAVRFIIAESKLQWVCRFDRGQLAEIQSGHGGLPEAFGFNVAQDAFSELVTGRRTLQRAFFDGDAEILGRVEQALKMVPIMAAFIKEFPVRVG